MQDKAILQHLACEANRAVKLLDVLFGMVDGIHDTLKHLEHEAGLLDRLMAVENNLIQPQGVLRDIERTLWEQSL